MISSKVNSSNYKCNFQTTSVIWSITSVAVESKTQTDQLTERYWTTEDMFCSHHMRQGNNIYYYDVHIRMSLIWAMCCHMYCIGEYVNITFDMVQTQVHTDTPCAYLIEDVARCWVLWWLRSCEVSVDRGEQITSLLPLWELFGEWQGWSGYTRTVNQVVIHSW